MVSLWNLKEVVKCETVLFISMQYHDLEAHNAIER